MAFRFLTAGESHGKALTGIIEGIPSGLPLDKDYLHRELKRRKLGFGRGARQNIETDEVEIVSGVRLGQTLGGPIALSIVNRDWGTWREVMQIEELRPCLEVKRQVHIPRPGHADLVGGIKYDFADMRNVLERSSARETAIRVALGTVARRFLDEINIRLVSRVVQIGEIVDRDSYDVFGITSDAVDASVVRVLNRDAEARMISEIERAKKAGDTLGGIFEVVALNVPIGLGSYVQWDRRLEARIGAHFLSLNAIKGVEIGLGFEAARTPGALSHDEIVPGDAKKRPKYLTNRSGGIDGGMTTGQPVVVRAAMKPISTLMRPLQSVDMRTNEATRAHVERSDVCAVPAAAVIAESLLALVLTEACLEKFGGDSMGEFTKRVKDWNEMRG
jgi:chorismate synthase